MILLTIFDIVVLFTPGGEGTWPDKFFEIMSFNSTNGSNYGYRYFLFGLVVIDSLLTYGVERLIVSKVT